MLDEIWGTKSEKILYTDKWIVTIERIIHFNRNFILLLSLLFKTDLRDTVKRKNISYSEILDENTVNGRYGTFI